MHANLDAHSDRIPLCEHLSNTEGPGAYVILQPIDQMLPGSAQGPAIAEATRLGKSQENSVMRRGEGPDQLSRPLHGGEGKGCDEALLPLLGTGHAAALARSMDWPRPACAAWGNRVLLCPTGRAEQGGRAGARPLSPPTGQAKSSHATWRRRPRSQLKNEPSMRGPDARAPRQALGRAQAPRVQNGVVEDVASGGAWSVACPKTGENRRCSLPPVTWPLYENTH